MPNFINTEVSQILREIAAVYEITDENRFRVSAYNDAADSIEHLPSEAKDYFDNHVLDQIPGVGKNIASYLEELFTKGKVKHFESLKKKMPAAMFELLIIPSVGPKTAYKLAKNLKIKTITDLKKACKAGKISQLEGFGELREKEILKGIEELSQRSDRMLLPYAWNISQQIIAHLQKTPACLQIEALGSLRRMVSTIGDIDIAVATNNPQSVIKAFTGFPSIARILSQGRTKASILLKNGRQIDLITGKPKAFGALLQHSTGSKNHNIHLRELAIQKGLSLSEYGIQKGKRKLEFADEKSFYNYLGLDYIPPELREDQGEIEAAQTHQLPKLIDSKDIKGDLHTHCYFKMRSSHDLGMIEMADLAKKGVELGYQYIALGNHSPAISHYNQKQIGQLIQRKRGQVEQLQSSLPKIRVLNMFEVDILASGKLSISDENLAKLDFVIASVHSSLAQSREKITQRLINTLENPYVHAIGHPSNRLLLEREASDVDWDKVFKVCAKNQKFMEINAFPDRLDLSDELVRQAKSYGVKFIINTDAHQLEQMDFMKFGVSVARRGWLEKKDVINTLNWNEFKKILHHS